MTTLYIFFTNLWPTFYGVGAREFNYGAELLYPGMIVFVLFMILWPVSMLSKKVKASSVLRFIMWLGLKIGVVAIFVGLLFFAIGGIKLLISKF